MRFHVSLTDSAHQDVDQILEQMTERTRQGAATWADRWDEILDTLSHNAGHCGLAPESDEYPAEIRQVIFSTRRGKPYRALFVIRNDQAIVIHVRGPGQDVVKHEDLNLPEE